MKLTFLLLVAIAVLNIGCTKHKTQIVYCPTGSGSPITGSRTTPCGADPIAIYKTKYDYSNNVSVLLSNDHTKVDAFPGVKDVTTQRPVLLANGYYLQLMPGNAFTSYTIDQYAEGPQNYSDQDFLNHVIDCAPFTEYWVGCGSVTDTASINNIIRTGKMSTFFKKVN